MDVQIAEIASIIGEPVRAKILWALLDGRAYTATELSLFANSSPQNTSIHLRKLLQHNFLSVTSQGRHRYYRFANDNVAYAIEGMANLIPPGREKPTSPTIKNGVKYCRTCYDHLAGKVGVQINDALITQKIITDNYQVTDKGAEWFLNIDIDVRMLMGERRIFAKPCLDWSERRFHLAGALGASLLERLLMLDWIRRVKNSREVVVSSIGETELHKKLGIML